MRVVVEGSFRWEGVVAYGYLGSVVGWGGLGAFVFCYFFFFRVYGVG